MFTVILGRKQLFIGFGAVLLLLVFLGGAAFRQRSIAASAELPEKVVYLTFDDGPSAVTPEILDVLAEKEVKATFFVIGATTERGKNLYNRIIEEGHTLGLHTYSHRYQDIYASADSFLADLFKLREHIYTITGVECDLFRFPGGSINATAAPNVLETIKQQTAEMGLTYFDWNALGKDDKAKPTPAEDIVRSVVETAGDRDRILILLHDDGLRTTAPEAVSRLIDYYMEKGYTFLPLTPETEPIIF